MRDYGKVHTRFWSSETTRNLSDMGRLLALYLITSPHSTISGVFPLPDGYVCEDMQWTAEQVREGFVELLREGFANRCETTKWVWVIKHLEWNPPENPNQRKAAVKVAVGVPEKVTWRPVFMRVCGPSIGLESPVEAKPLLTLVEPLPNQKQEQKQKQKQKKGAKAPLSADGLPTWMTDLIAVYHEVLPELPGIRVMDKEREQALLDFRDWVMTSRRPDGSPRATDDASMLAWARDYFDRARSNDWIMGRAPRSAEHKNWRCSIEFLLSAKGVKKVVEETEEAA